MRIIPIMLVAVLSVLSFNCAGMFEPRVFTIKDIQGYNQFNFMKWAKVGMTKETIEHGTNPRRAAEMLNTDSYYHGDCGTGKLRVLYSSVDALGTWETCYVYGQTMTASFRNGILVDISKY